MFEHTLLALSKIKSDELDLIYAVIFHDVGKPAVAQKRLKDEGWVISTKGHADVSAFMFKEAAKRLRFEAKSAKKVEWAVKHHMLMMNYHLLSKEQQIEWARQSDFRLLTKLWLADSAGTLRLNKKDNVSRTENLSYRLALSWLKKIQSKEKLIKQLTDGKLIMSRLRISPGPEVQRVKSQIVRAVLGGKIKTKRDLQYFLKKILDNKKLLHYD